jgi:hypothetical protein
MVSGKLSVYKNSERKKEGGDALSGIKEFSL